MTNTYAAPCAGLEPTWWLYAPATTVLPETATEDAEPVAAGRIGSLAVSVGGLGLGARPGPR